MYYLLFFVVLIFVAAWFFQEHFKKIGEKVDFSVYERKAFLFDNVTELNLFRILLELFGNEYHIFAQVNYSHLIQPKKTDFQEERKYRSRIDRKSADFVLCDKAHVVPQLIIELDGSVHNFASKQKRDEFINDITKVVGLPVLHIKTGNLSKEFIRASVIEKLNKVPITKFA
jgi:very-short-patch-repair endonuclease